MSNVTLRQLARAFGVQTAYLDIAAKRRVATDEALVAVLQVLGAEVHGPRDADAAWMARARELWGQLAEPVVVAWDGCPEPIGLRLKTDSRLELELELEGGEARSWTVDAAELPVLGSVELDGSRVVERQLALPGPLPPGYHLLRIGNDRRRAEVLVISAPRRAHQGQGSGHERLWGVFAPIYALRSRTDWGCGDYTHLERLGRWVAGLGGGIVATLPFCCSFLDTLFAPSPYSPASRLFWNELFVDPGRAPNLARCPEARALVERFADGEARALREAAHVDYREAWRLRRRVLEPLARQLFNEGGPERDELVAFTRERPAVLDYARFRAATERDGRPWHQWPARQRGGKLRPVDGDPGLEQLHIYVQWLADRQIDALARGARQRGPGLYVDLPLGVHDCGYDAWRHQSLFPLEIDVGAPPDALFTEGQKWGFPPIHPLRARHDHYRHVIDYLGNITRKAGILRVDHVMGLHRLFWIPKGMPVKHGVYVRYPAEELYAILSLESHRNRCVIVGENLGTVPGYVNRAMRRHGIHGMYVLQYELGGKRPPPVPRAAVASLNTHDMPPFAGFWRGMDITQRRELALTDDDGARRERLERDTVTARLAGFLRGAGWLGPGTDEQGVLEACLAFLGAGDARMVLVNLEDLWLESAPQNVPGIGDDRLPNWRRKLRLALEALDRVDGPLRTLDRLRQTEGDA